MKSLQESILGSQVDMAKEITSNIELEAIFKTLLTSTNYKDFGPSLQIEGLKDFKDKLIKACGDNVIEIGNKLSPKNKLIDDQGFWIIYKDSPMLDDCMSMIVVIYSLGQTTSVENPLQICYEPLTNKLTPFYRDFGRGCFENIYKVLKMHTKEDKWSSYRVDNIYFIPSKIDSDVHKKFRAIYPIMKRGRF